MNIDICSDVNIYIDIVNINIYDANNIIILILILILLLLMIITVIKITSRNLCVAQSYR